MNSDKHSIGGIDPKYPWPKTPYESLLFDRVLELEAKQREFPWYPFLAGVATGNLIWVFIFMVTINN